MIRLRNIEGIKDALKHKQVELVENANGIIKVKLLEQAGKHKTGTIFSSMLEHIEEVDEAANNTRYYDKDFAETLDEKLNQPYESQNTPCANDACDNESGFNYTNTGYIIDDEQGLYVEKKCAECGTLTTDGDGDFFAYFVLDGGEIIDIEQETRE